MHRRSVRPATKPWRAYSTAAVDAVFLDVQMPKEDRASTCSAPSAPNVPPVVFVTAYDEFAVMPSKSTPWITC